MRNTMFVVSFLMLLAGCANGDYETRLADKSWKLLAVEYCVGNGPVVEKKQWCTMDREVLDRLKAEFKVQRADGLWGICRMSTNRLEVLLEDGSNVTAFVYDRRSLSIYYPAREQKSYSLDVDEGFIDALREAIAESTGDVPRFYYDQEVEIVPAASVRATEGG